MNPPQNQSGFTLIEMIIAVGIFVLVLQVVAGAYGRFVRVEREGIGQQEMQEDVRLFLQLFNREARTAFGNTYQRVVVPYPGIVFRNQENHCVVYYVQNGAIFRSDTAGDDRIAPTVAADVPCADFNIYNGRPHRRLTDARNTVVESLAFDAPYALPPFPSQDTLTQQGFIVVYLSVRSKGPDAELMQLQSTVTSRQLIPYPHTP